MTEPGFQKTDKQLVFRGVVITLIGRVASLSNAVFFLAGRALYGGSPFGLFAIAISIVELLSNFLVGGFADAVTYFGARYLAKKDDARLYSALAAAFLWPLLAALLAMVVILLAAPAIYDAVWVGHHSRELVVVLQIVAVSLPLIVLVKLPVEAVKATMDMKWAVLVVDTCLPLLNLSYAVVYWALGFGIRGLALAWVSSYVTCLPLAWFGYTRYFSVSKTLRALPRAVSNREVRAFALPQSVNMMLNFGLVRVDVLMLSGFVSSNLIGIYTIVSEMARTIRTARTSFVGVFAPLVSKYKELGNTAGIVESLHAILRWTTAVGLVLTLVLLAFYPELAQQRLNPPKWPLSYWIPWMLAAGPLLSCLFGLSGNLLLMTGHSRLLLVNSSVSMAVNIALNFALIPRWGPLGAAFATLVSNVLLNVLQLWEMRHFESIRLDFGIYLKPLVAVVLPGAAIVWLTSASGQAFVYSGGAIGGLAAKVGITVGAVVLFGVGVLVWPGDNPERQWLVARLRSRSSV